MEIFTSDHPSTSADRSAFSNDEKTNVLPKVKAYVDTIDLTGK